MGEAGGGEHLDESAMIALVHGLLQELHPNARPRPIALDMALDRDLGLDSLARIELAARIERAFGVDLPESVFVQAETLRDLLTAMAGQFASHQDEGDEPELVEREDGSLLIAGAMTADALAERLGLDLPEDREFATAAGYVLYMLKHLPVEGEHFTDQGWSFEVVDMDGRKIDKLLVCEVS